MSTKSDYSTTFSPIGFVHCQEMHPYDAPRQAELADNNPGEVRLLKQHNYEQALRDLEGFSRIWLLYLFDRNPSWKPMIRPPRGQRKVGVFASRAPYRPNPIGLSCVELVDIQGLTLHIKGHDLLHGTPILDIKPYLPYADSFPEASTGWLEQLEAPFHELEFSPLASEQLQWLREHNIVAIAPFIRQQLETQPTDSRRKRVRELPDGSWEIAYRTWRIQFTLAANPPSITIQALESGYSKADLANPDDPYQDKAIHRAYRNIQWTAGSGR
jgi:tRNA-Thr(GGU) m(6)t(6)A37 methyltransferase TsaA